jgi:hypothetical protein
MQEANMNGKRLRRSALLLATLIAGPLIQAQPPASSAIAASPTCTQPATPNGPLRLVADARLLAVRHGEGAASVSVINTSDSPVSLDLAAQPATECTSSAVLPSAKLTITAPDQVKSLAPKATVSIQVAVTGLTDASIAQTTIENAGVPIGSLTLVELDAPLNIAVTASGTADKPLDYSYKQPITLSLTNGDPTPYHLGWQFLIEGNLISHGVLNLPANATELIPLKESCTTNARADYCKGYSIIDPVHPTVKAGVLRLSLLAPGAVPQGILPARSVPVTLVMRLVGPTISLLLSYGYAALILLLGGLLSFLASSVLPVMQRKGDLRAQLQAIANRTSTISVRVDSYLRVLLRLERKRIEATIAAASPWVPSSNDPLTHVAVAMEVLSNRLAAAERLDELRRKHDQIAGTAPPSVIDSIDLVLQTAAEQLHSTMLTDAEIVAANAYLAKAQGMLDLLDDSAAVAKLIAANMVALKTRLGVFPLSFYEDLRAALPGLFAILDRGFDDPQNIVRPMFFAIDHGIAAIHLLLDYAMVRVTVPSSPSHMPQPSADADSSWAAPQAALVSPEACAQLGNASRKRLLDRQCTLFELLGTLSWLALREAALLVQEMREDTYEEDVLSEITNPGQAEIAIDTQRTRPLLPIFFSIGFKDPRFNNAAALRRLACHWCFPDGMHELCWNVCHYFSGQERVPATPPQVCDPQPATPAPIPAPTAVPELPWLLFRRRHRRPPLQHYVVYAAISGRRMQQSQELPVPPLRTTIVVQKTKRADRARLVAEVVRFSIAFGIALAGLLSGALDQLSKLDFIPATIAILALGFGANSIKNLLTQPVVAPLPAAKSAVVTATPAK